MVKHLNAVLAEEIKARLWEGEIQAKVGQEFRVSQPQVSRICNGFTWKHIPWPDGSIGALPEDRIKLLLAQRQPSTGTSKWAGRLNRRLDEEEDRLHGLERLLDSQERFRAGGQITPSTSIIDSLLGKQKDKVADLLEEATGEPVEEPTLADEIDALGQAAEVEADQELLDAIRVPNEPKEKKPKKRKAVEAAEPEQIVPEHMAWDEVLARYGNEPLVKRASSTEDKVLQLAVAIAALELPKNKFESDDLPIYVKQIVQALKGDDDV